MAWRHLFPLTFSHLVEPGVISLSRAVEMLTVSPSRIIGLSKGTLSEGVEADVSLFDLHAEKKVDVNLFKSKGKNSPFNGWNLKGWCNLTIVSGEIKFEDKQSV